MEISLTPSLINDRMAAARKAIAEAERTIAARTAEIADLEAVSRVFVRLADAPARPELPGLEKRVEAGARADEHGNPYKPNTNKAFMWQVLSEAITPWMTANELQTAASSLRGAEIPMSSVSPALSEMKVDGTIEREGWHVALVSRAKENGLPKGSPDTALTAQ